MKTKSLFALLIILCLSLSLFACSDNNSNSGRKEKLSKTAMTINNTNINALEFQIYFHTVYNNFLNSTSGGSNYGLDSSKSLNEQSCGIAVSYTHLEITCEGVTVSDPAMAALVNKGIKVIN